MQNPFFQIFNGLQPMEPRIPQVFRRKYHAYSPAYWESVNKQKLEQGDKIVVPASALDELSRMHVQFPIMFQIAHDSDLLPKISHCSVMEFTAPEGAVYLPMWMINNLGLDPGGESVVQLTTVSLPKGEFVQFQAHETKFAMLSNPRVVLEKALRLYSCLTVGDTIQVEFAGVIYKLDVTDVNPKKQTRNGAPFAVSIIETDIRVDFKEPRDYKEWEEKQKKQNILKNNVQKENEEEEDFIKVDNTPSNTKISHFEQLIATGSQPFKLKNLKSGQYQSSSQNDYNMKNKYNVVPPATRGQSLGYQNSKTSNINQNKNNSNNFNNFHSSSKKTEEIIGNMRYIYEIDDNGNRKLIKRLPIRNLQSISNQSYSLKSNEKIKK